MTASLSARPWPRREILRGWAAVVAGTLILTLPSDLLSMAALEICVMCGDAVLSDAINNIVLSVPLGLALASVGPWRRPWRLLLLLSLGIEIAPLSAPRRYSAVSDVVTNTAGAVLGGICQRDGTLTFEQRSRASHRRRASASGRNLRTASRWRWRWPSRSHRPSGPCIRCDPSKSSGSRSSARQAGARRRSTARCPLPMPSVIE